MIAERKDWPIERRATWDPIILWETQAAPGDNFVPVNLTGCTGHMIARTPEGTQIAVPVQIVSPATAGKFGPILTAAETAALEPGELSYDLFLQFPSGGPRRKVYYGTLTVRDSLTPL